MIMSNITSMTVSWVLTIIIIILKTVIIIDFKFIKIVNSLVRVILKSK